MIGSEVCIKSEIVVCVSIYKHLRSPSKDPLRYWVGDLVHQMLHHICSSLHDKCTSAQPQSSDYSWTSLIQNSITRRCVGTTYNLIHQKTFDWSTPVWPKPMLNFRRCNFVESFTSYAVFPPDGTFQYGFPISMTIVGAVQTKKSPDAATHIAAIWKNCCSCVVPDNDLLVESDWREVLDIARRLRTRATMMSVLQKAIIANGPTLTSAKAIHGRTYNSNCC